MHRVAAALPPAFALRAGPRTRWLPRHCALEWTDSTRRVQRGIVGLPGLPSSRARIERYHTAEVSVYALGYCRVPPRRGEGGWPMTPRSTPEGSPEGCRRVLCVCPLACVSALCSDVCACVRGGGERGGSVTDPGPARVPCERVWKRKPSWPRKVNARNLPSSKDSYCVTRAGGKSACAYACLVFLWSYGQY